MNTHTDKTQEHIGLTATNNYSKKDSTMAAFQFVDNRSETINQRKLQELLNQRNQESRN